MASETARFFERYAQPQTGLAEQPRKRERFLVELEAAPELTALLDGAFATNVVRGRYEVDGVVGQGAQGTILSARDRKTGARVCLKLFDFRHAADWKAVELFEREVAALERLSHPQLPAFIEAFDDEASQVRCLVMSRVGGQSYKAHLDEAGPLTEAELWLLLADTAEVLKYLHGEAGLIHRDIKPDNLVRTPEGRTALVDLGGVTAPKKAAGSTVVGTLGYMAPEQLYGSAYFSTDLYALGATTLHLATGMEPDALPRKGLAIDVDQAVPHLSLALRYVLKKLLSPEPQQRPQAATALQELLVAAPEASQTGWRARRIRKKEARKVKTKKKRTKNAPHPPAVERKDPYVDARFEAPLQSATTHELSGGLQIAVGVLGTIGIVVAVDVFVSLLLTLAAAFSQGSQKQKLNEAHERVQKFSREQKRRLARTIDQGATSFDEAEHKRRRQRASGKHRRRS